MSETNPFDIDPFAAPAETVLRVETLPAPAKPAIQSTTIIAAGVTVVASLLGAAGIVLAPEDVEKWTKLLIDLWPLGVTLFGGVAAAIGRYRASRPISGGPADEKMIVQRLLQEDSSGKC